MPSETDDEQQDRAVSPPEVTRRRPAPLEHVVRQWTRIGVTGFGGPPVHIALLRKLVVEREGWLDEETFEDAIAACGMLPGPTSTQLAIFCAYRAGGPAGAILGGLGFIAPAVVAILALSLLFLAQNPPLWVRGAGAGAGAVVAAVALRAGLSLLGPSWRRLPSASSSALPNGAGRHHRWREALRARAGWRAARWVTYLLAGATAAAVIGPYLVLVIVGAGALELASSRRWPGTIRAAVAALPGLAAHRGPGARRPAQVLGALGVVGASGGLGALAWTALKVGALSFGGGFVIVPLMQGDAVHVHHWMTGPQFLNAVALGQVTPGPVVATVAAVGYAEGGIGAGLLAALVAFAPSFAFVLVAGDRFERLRGDQRVRAFLDGAGPAAVGAIIGAAIPLAAALSETWQAVLLAVGALVLLVLDRGIVPTLLAAGVVGVVGALLGLPVP